MHKNFTLFPLDTKSQTLEKSSKSQILTFPRAKTFCVKNIVSSRLADELSTDLYLHLTHYNRFERSISEKNQKELQNGKKNKT